MEGRGRFGGRLGCRGGGRDVFIESYQLREKSMQDELDNRFTYHSPSESQAERYIALRNKAKELAGLIAELTPESREQSMAMAHLERPACGPMRQSLETNKGD